MQTTRKKIGIYIGVGTIITMVCSALLLWSVSPEEQQLVTLDAHVNGVPLTLEIATSTEAHRRGLSGRQELSEGRGMLFVFSRDGRYGFWMPDMHFSIDIVWLDNRMQIVYIEESVSPKSYPKIFTPDKSARYVLEVPAGWIKENNIVVGNTLVLDGR